MDVEVERFVSFLKAAQAQSVRMADTANCQPLGDEIVPKKRLIATLAPLFMATLAAMPFAAEAANPAYVGNASWWSAGASASQQAELEIVGEGAEYMDLRIRVPGVEIAPGVADAAGYASVLIPGETTLHEVGAPAVPVIARWLALPDGAQPQIELLSEKRATRAIDPVFPAQPSAMRTGGEDVPFTVDRAAYEAGGTFPHSAVTLGAPSRLRGQTIARLELHPVRYDAAAGELSVATEMTIRIRYGKELPPVASTLRSPSFTRALGGRLLAPKNATRATNPGPEAMESMLVVLGKEEFAASMEEFIQWKERRGLNVIVKTMADIGSDENALTTEIQSVYDDESVNLAYVLLVGNEDSVPIHHISASQDTDGRGESDYLYTLTDGDDNQGDVFLGRFSGADAGQIATQARKALYYEREIGNAEGDFSWLQKAIGIASNQSGGGPSDTERMKVIVGQFEDIGFTKIDTAYEDFNPSSNDIVKWLNEGRAWIAYMGHGSGVSWNFNSGWGFRLSHLDQVKNSWKWPVVVDCACSNGDFWNREPSFTEAWQRSGSESDPYGSLAMISSTILAAWDEPAVMEEGIIEAVVTEPSLTLGGAMMAGLLKMEEEFGQSGTVILSQKTFINFGDPSLLVRNAQPIKVDFESAAGDGGSVEVTVKREDGDPGYPAIVAVSLENELIVAAATDEDGVAVLEIPDDVDADTLDLVITGHNLTALEGELKLEEGDDDDEDDDDDTGDDDDNGEGDDDDDDESEGDDDEDDDDTSEDDDDEDEDDDDASEDDEDDDDASQDDDDASEDDDEDDDESDSDLSADGDDSSSGGCSVTSQGSSGAAGLMLLGLMGLVRRRRSS